MSANGSPVYEAKWRHEGGQVKRRIGPAWLERDGDGWRRRRGRLPEDHFDERRATVRMAELIADHPSRAESDASEKRARRERPPTFREVMAEWLEWLEQVRGARESTLRGYRSLLAEPGTNHRRGKGTTRGLILAEFGDRAISEITTTDVSKFLRSLDAVFPSPRTVNTHRQVLSAIFNYAPRGHLPPAVQPRLRHRQAPRAAGRRAGLLRARRDRGPCTGRRRRRAPQGGHRPRRQAHGPRPRGVHCPR